jgi:hypothetical protein
MSKNVIFLFHSYFNEINALLRKKAFHLYIYPVLKSRVERGETTILFNVA